MNVSARTETKLRVAVIGAKNPPACSPPPRRRPPGAETMIIERDVLPRTPSA